MFHRLFINIWKFFLSGNGMTIRTGRYFGRAAALGAMVGLVTVAFLRLIEFGHEFIGVERLAVSHRWALFFLPALGAVAGEVVTTLGARGCRIRSTGEIVPAPSVRAVDTTGAGDTFNGVLAVRLAEGDTLTDACRAANEAAARSTTVRYVLGG